MVDFLFKNYIWEVFLRLRFEFPKTNNDHKKPKRSFWTRLFRDFLRTRRSWCSKRCFQKSMNFSKRRSRPLQIRPRLLRCERSLKCSLCDSIFRETPRRRHRVERVFLPEVKPSQRRSKRRIRMTCIRITPNRT